jgi:hypothetical protein
MPVSFYFELFLAKSLFLSYKLWQIQGLFSIKIVKYCRDYFSQWVIQNLKHVFGNFTNSYNELAKISSKKQILSSPVCPFSFVLVRVYSYPDIPK